MVFPIIAHILVEEIVENAVLGFSGAGPEGSGTSFTGLLPLCLSNIAITNAFRFFGVANPNNTVLAEPVPMSHYCRRIHNLRKLDE